MNVTIAICTWNQADLLDQTLQHMLHMRVPSGVTWELLIVLNRCTDHTSCIVEKYQDRLPIRCIREELQGLSFARNAAIEAASSEWLIFTDDDVLVDETWFESYCREFQAADASLALLGGEIQPWFPEVPNPDLVSAIPTVGTGFCGLTIPDTPMILEGSDLPLGANFAIRLSGVGDLRFDTNLGVFGRTRVAGEETEFMRQLMAKGLSGRWVKNARVRHYVNPNRFSIRYLKNHLVGIGRGIIRTSGIPNGRRVLGIPLWIIREVTESTFAMCWYYITKQKERFYRHFAVACVKGGMLFEIVRAHFSRA